MINRPTLTLAFITHAPASAAEVLEQLDAGEAAGFLEQIPARLAAPVVSHMSSWSGARCVEQLSETQIAAILQNLSFHDSAGLMRQIEAARHPLIFEELSTRLARRLRNALRYSPGSVGAWIDPEIPSFADDGSVGDALRYLAESSAASHVFLHYRDSGRVAGAIPVTTLLRSDAGVALAELPAERVRPLSSRATLASVAFVPEWDSFLMLPVIGRNKSLVGGLSRASLRRGLHEHHTEHAAIPGTVAGHLLSALTVTCTGLLRIVSAPNDRQTKGSIDG